MDVYDHDEDAGLVSGSDGMQELPSHLALLRSKSRGLQVLALVLPFGLRTAARPLLPAGGHGI